MKLKNKTNKLDINALLRVFLLQQWTEVLASVNFFLLKRKEQEYIWTDCDSNKQYCINKKIRFLF